MKIGLDVRILHFARTGFYRYVIGLLESSTALAPGGDLVLLAHPGFRPVEACFRKFPRVVIHTPLFAAGEAAEFNREIDGRGFDLIHFPSSLSLPVSGCATLVTIHDLTCVRYPQTMQKEHRPHYLNTLTHFGHKQHVSVVSEAVRADLLGRGYRQDRVFRIYPDTPFERRRPRQPKHWNVIETKRGTVELRQGGYILSVGAMEPRKNLRTLLYSYQSFRTGGGPELPLVLVSHHGWSGGDATDVVSDMDRRGDIYIATQVRDGQLAALYRYCAVCVFTSFYEGFGFVPLEALRYGAPLLSSPTPSLVEAGYPAALLIQPDDCGRFARGIQVACTKRDEFMEHQSGGVRDVARYYRAQDKARMGVFYRRLIRGPA